MAAGLPESRQQFFRQLLTQAGIQIVSAVPASGLYLQADDAGLALAMTGQKGCVRVDFVHGKAQHRRLFGGGELLARAVQAANRPRIWDATGGLGRDAFVLATLGLTVQIFERHPIVSVLLQDGLARASAAAATAPIAARMHLHCGSITILTTPVEPPEVVYLDPMYPQRQKSAAVKKEMAYFHALVGSDTLREEHALLVAAQRLACKRIVVKRPLNGEFLAGKPPAFQYQGKTTRFDVYLPHH